MIRIYTNNSEKTIDLRVGFSLLKNYINSKYENISLAIEWAERIIQETTCKWAQEKVDRQLPPLDCIKQIHTILWSRFENDIADTLSRFILFLSYETDNPKNKFATNEYKDLIINSLPLLCDATDALDNETIASICDALTAKTKGLPGNADYQARKIYYDLFDDSPDRDREYALVQAKEFSTGFAQKWVRIDTNAMSLPEIRILAMAACYLERKELDKQKVTRI